MESELVRERWQCLNYNVKCLLRHNTLFTLVNARGGPHERVYIIFSILDETLRYQAIQHEAANRLYSPAQKHIRMIRLLNDTSQAAPITACLYVRLTTATKVFEYPGCDGCKNRQSVD